MPAADLPAVGDQTIIVVSGLPRSGTSLMMQMLAAGGIPVATDGQRTADDDNPRGYYEFERVKALSRDAAWLPEVRGQAIKIVSQLLFALPTTETYRVILMRRDLEEILASQTTMLARSGRVGGDAAKVCSAFASHLSRLDDWLPLQSHITALPLDYAAVIVDPQGAAAQVVEFLDRPLDASAMAAAVDPA
ncbi:MAG: sulfotransferase domain-containing protein, partial [Planctomycetales bacterium]|nr:sulfotransferase domain-containing protein [Planctomycetales bacterium]